MKAWEPSCHGRCLSPTVARAGSGWRGVSRRAHGPHFANESPDMIPPAKCHEMSFFGAFQSFSGNPDPRFDTMSYTWTETLVPWILSRRMGGGSLWLQGMLPLLRQEAWRKRQGWKGWLREIEEESLVAQLTQLFSSRNWYWEVSCFYHLLLQLVPKSLKTSTDIPPTDSQTVPYRAATSRKTSHDPSWFPMLNRPFFRRWPPGFSCRVLVFLLRRRWHWGGETRDFSVAIR